MKRILIIDDESAMRDTIAMVLESSGYQTLQAESGEKGLGLAREFLPDLTICDVNMPQMDGTRVLTAFRADADLAMKPFVMMTGNPTQTPQRVGMNLGADDYLVKPFKMPDLLQCVETRLKRAELHWRVEGKTLQELRSTLHTVLPHEFFTPLAGIIGLSEVLREEAAELTTDKIVSYAADIERSGQRLHRTLRNYLKILDLDQSEASARPARPLEPLTATETASVVETTVKAVAQKHHRTDDLTLKLQPATPGVERDTLAVFAEELAENACGFSRHGTPLTVEFFPEKGSVVLRVTDKGRGMTEEQINRIGAFMQFDRKRYEQQGLGLGLSLVGRLLQRAGGTLNVQSAMGEGTTVTLTVPGS
ncbi:MAG TPA: hybrid sensor histidine kinase/response regulator [Opitutaceae bacterium]|nr:hybrid sensor histidine kinase/response regulator [Opitutaceae bacterium]